VQLIFGLGNPGTQYALTRHNVGFMVAEYLASEAGISLNRRRFQAITGEGMLAGEKVMLAEPQTYMNLSGRSVGEAVRFYQVDVGSLIVIHDEVDLPFGRLKVKKGGGHAGHNGLRSIVEVLGSADFIRVRVGVGRPATRIPMADYVLSPFSTAEREQLDGLLREAADAVGCILKDGLVAAMNRYNGATAERGNP
jgi:PTH1 family peptidyl-tRNA hydrolase